jgi:putative flippase GtrA
MSRHYLWQFVTFALISSTGLALTLGILYVAVEIFSQNYLVAKLIALVLSFAWNYLGQSRITFSLGKHRISGDRRDYLR